MFAKQENRIKTLENVMYNNIAQPDGNIILQATDLDIDTSNFDNFLSPSDDTVQKALDTLDDHIQDAAHGGTGINSSSSSGVPKVNSGTWSIDATTDDLPEGSNNKYYTKERATQDVIPDGTDRREAKGLISATYDFAEHGGSVGTIGLGVTIPQGAIITRCFYEVIDALTSDGSATVEFGWVGDTAALVAQAAYNGTSFSVGYHSGVQDNTVANFKSVTAESEIAITIGTADLTGGEIAIYVEYVMGK